MVLYKFDYVIRDYFIRSDMDEYYLKPKEMIDTSKSIQVNKDKCIKGYSFVRDAMDR